MKILYAIQGTGNGHVARATDVIPILKKFGDVDIALSGNQSDINLPWKIKYRLRGASFIFGKKGGVDLFKTFKNISVVSFFYEIFKVKINNYDIVISDFEPVVSWACKLKGKTCIGISHQSAVLHPDAPKPEKYSLTGKLILKYYAPTSRGFGFHFKSLSDSIFTPVIREDVRRIQPTVNNHYTVYLPSYSDEKIISFLSQFKESNWHVFSKHSKKSYSQQNIIVEPVNKEGFVKSMTSAKGVLCNAGFETPAEALYLKKKLCVLPMAGQYEQHCNAAMLKSMGIPVYYSLNEISESEFGNWLKSSEIISVDYPNDTEWIISTIVKAHAQQFEDPIFA